MLTVVTRRDWTSHEYSAAFSAVADQFGYDLYPTRDSEAPVFDRPSAWWGNTLWAARMYAAGVQIPLVAPGGQWLSSLPENLLGRQVWAVTLRAVEALTCESYEAWWKVSEAKASRLRARLCHTSEFWTFAIEEGVPLDALVQCSAPIDDIVEEHRVFIADYRAVTSSPYLIDGSLWHPGMRSDHDGGAIRFAQKVIDRLGPESQPSHYALDLVLTSRSRWFVLDAHPSWAAAPIGCDLNQVVRSVLGSCAPDDRWQWRAGAYLDDRVESLPDLKRVEPREQDVIKPPDSREVRAALTRPGLLRGAKMAPRISLPVAEMMGRIGQL